MTRSTSSALSTVDLNADGEANASAARLGFGVAVAGEFGDGEHCYQDAPQFEDRELAVVHHLRPTHPLVEVAKRAKVAGAESDQVGERKLVGHASSIRPCADNGPRRIVRLSRCGGARVCGQLLSSGGHDRGGSRGLDAGQRFCDGGAAASADTGAPCTDPFSHKVSSTADARTVTA